MDMEAKKPAFKFRREPRKLLGRLIRVSVALVAILAIFGLIAGRQVYAQANDAAFDFGSQLLRIHEGAVAGDVPGDYYDLRINGQDISIASAVTARSMAFVLDYFEQQCKGHADGMVEHFVVLQHTLEQDTLPTASGVAGLGTLHQEKGRRGYVCCFASVKETTTTEKMEMIKSAF